MLWLVKHCPAIMKTKLYTVLPIVKHNLQSLDKGVIIVLMLQTAMDFNVFLKMALKSPNNND